MRGITISMFQWADYEKHYIPCSWDYYLERILPRFLCSWLVHQPLHRWHLPPSVSLFSSVGYKYTYQCFIPSWTFLLCSKHLLWIKWKLKMSSDTQQGCFVDQIKDKSCMWKITCKVKKLNGPMHPQHM